MYVLAWVFGILVVVIVAGYLYMRVKLSKLKKANEAARLEREERLADLPAIPLSERDGDAVYQWSNFHGERLVARVVGPDVDEESKTISFVEVTHSDYLLLPDECQYQKYKLEIDTVQDAMKVDKSDPEKGRILRDVSAKIVGYVEH